jgi:hypothetical protein
VVDERAAVAFVDEGERLRHLRRARMSTAARLEQRWLRDLKRFADTRALDYDVVETTAVGQGSHLRGGLQRAGCRAGRRTSLSKSSRSVQQMQPFCISIILSFTPTARVPTVFTSAASMLT